MNRETMLVLQVFGVWLTVGFVGGWLSNASRRGR